MQYEFIGVVILVAFAYHFGYSLGKDDVEPKKGLELVITSVLAGFLFAMASVAIDFILKLLSGNT